MDRWLASGAISKEAARSAVLMARVMEIGARVTFTEVRSLEGVHPCVEGTPY